MQECRPDISLSEKETVFGSVSNQQMNRFLRIHRRCLVCSSISFVETLHDHPTLLPKRYTVLVILPLVQEPRWKQLSIIGRIIPFENTMVD